MDYPCVLHVGFDMRKLCIVTIATMRCLICKKEIIDKHCQVCLQKRKFCSAKCMGMAYRNRIVSQETRKRLSISLIGRKFTKKHKTKISNALKNNINQEKHHSEETKKKIGLMNIGKHSFPRPEIRGENHPNWKCGISKVNKSDRELAMQTFEYKLWRKSVFERDDYTCQMCLKRGYKLQADHIKSWSLFPELRYAIDNGRTLCEDCHRNTNTWGFKKLYQIERLKYGD